MITEIRAKNCFSFEEQVVFSMKADMRNKRLASNVCSIGHFNVLKTAGIYGSNNSGKTNLLKCIRAIWGIIMNKDFSIASNYFSESNVVELGVTFIFDEREFSYDIRFDILKREYVYERFCEITKDTYGNEKTNLWLLRDSLESEFESSDADLKNMIGIIARSNILIHLVDTAKFEHMNEIKRILVGFASKIDIVDVNNIPLKKTIELLKNKGDICNKVVNFIKNADLYMDDYYYADDREIRLGTFEEGMAPQENVLSVNDQIFELMHLTSVYKGVKVPSVFVDSTGTKKIVALASFIIEALEQGRILIIDELDSSIHFKLTRAIVSMFNNELNSKAQMIFTVHDLNLMDCKRLFRKEQIWFVHKDEEGVYLYSLAEFTAKDGVRDTTDIIEKYRKGALGSLPEPELINSLLEISGNGGADE